MKIIISDVAKGVNKELIGINVTKLIQVTESCYGKGSVYLHLPSRNFFRGFFSGIYVVCLDDEGYPL